jgi:aminocarboxymuconate-semialdehyde decarboxylase
MSRARRSDGPVIDIHCHRECAVAGDFMKEAQVAAGKVPLGHGNATTRAVNERQLATIKPKMDQLDVRLADMDAMGVDVQAVAVAVYQYYYWADAELGAKVSRMMNEEFVESTSRYGDRFLPLGTVPLQDTDAAVAELRYLVQELGMRGIEIGTHVEGEEISSPRLEPFWAEVERLGAVVVIHTHGASHPQRLQQHNFVNIIGHPFEATLAQAHLIFSGVLERYPALKIVVVHGGGYLPAYPGRIDHGWRAR